MSATPRGPGVYYRDYDRPLLASSVSCGAVVQSRRLRPVGGIDIRMRLEPQRFPALPIVVVLMTALFVGAGLAKPVAADEPAAPPAFAPRDVFELEWASDPQIDPRGERVVYVRNFMDIMADRRRSNLWLAKTDGSAHQPLTTGLVNHRSPRWSPDGKRLLYVADTEHGAQLFVRWMDSGQTAQITRLTEAPSDLVWSPDGRWIALTMFVPRPAKPLVQPPTKPEGAEWAPAPKVIDKLIYRADGQGYLEEGFHQLFVVPAEGGTPRQITRGPYDHDSTPVWTPDGEALIFSANRDEDREHDPLDSELFVADVATGELRRLTDRQGPDASPALSPDGQRIAYVGFDDHYQGYQVRRLYVVDRDGGTPRELTGGLDRSVDNPKWSADGKSIYFLYEDHGQGRLARVTLDGTVHTVAEGVQGLSLGRPYTGGQFSLAGGTAPGHRRAQRGGRGVVGGAAFTLGAADHPADVAVTDGDGTVRRLTRLNDDLLGHRRLGAVEEIRFDSSHDGRSIQGWVVKPPDFDPEKRYPLILEIHGGPFAAYGPIFSPEIQLYAAAGYVVLYTNPRGSTSYGEEFGNLIHHAYPGNDYDDLMSGVDAVVAKGYVDPDQLFVTGGSGGGVLSAWIVGKTERFRAAVVAKPVIDWTSFVLTADAYNFFTRYWFSELPWEHPEAYWQRSPLSLVGNVKTPTMLLTGEADFRTPISQSEQFYQALKLRQVDTALVRVPGASHGIAGRPSQLIAKVQHVLAWFDEYRPTAE